MRSMYCLLVMSLCTNTYANNFLLDFVPDFSVRPYFITVSAGPAWTSAGQTQTYLLQNNIKNTYEANRNTSSLAVGELFLGLQSRLRTTFYGQLGFAVTGSSMAKLSGDIWQFAEPEYNNFNYTYDVNQLRFALKGKIITQDPITRLCVLPYVSASIGVSLNRAYNYNTVGKVYEAVPAPDFIDNTNTSYAATLGLGVQRKIQKHWQVGIGYELADWGYSNLGRAPGQTLNTGITLTHLYAHEMLLNLTYIA